MKRIQKASLPFEHYEGKNADINWNGSMHFQLHIYNHWKVWKRLIGLWDEKTDILSPAQSLYKITFWHARFHSLHAKAECALFSRLL